jgi:hypothetical protein
MLPWCGSPGFGAFFGSHSRLAWCARTVRSTFRITTCGIRWGRCQPRLCEPVGSLGPAPSAERSTQRRARASTQLRLTPARAERGAHSCACVVCAHTCVGKHDVSLGNDHRRRLIGPLATLTLRGYRGPKKALEPAARPLGPRTRRILVLRGVHAHVRKRTSRLRVGLGSLSRAARAIAVIRMATLPGF